MNTNEIIGAYLGNSDVAAIYLGDILIWPIASDKYVRVNQKTIWLIDSLSVDVQVESNTDWKVK